MIRLTCLAGLLLTAAPQPAAWAQSPAPKAAPMSCQQYMAEVAALSQSGGVSPDAAAAQDAPQPKKKKNLFGFAKKVAGVAAPMMLGGLGGGGMLGMLAAQGASAATAGGGAGPGIDEPSAVGVSSATQARMVELARSGAGRACADVPMSEALAGLRTPAR